MFDNFSAILLCSTWVHAHAGGLLKAMPRPKAKLNLWPCRRASVCRALGLGVGLSTDCSQASSYGPAQASNFCTAVG